MNELIDGMIPWPRKLVNFPIILIAIVQQFIWAAVIAFDPSSVHTTGVSILSLIFPRSALVFILMASATIAIMGFYVPNKVYNCILLVPQQALLFVSAGGALEAILRGQFADGVVRSHGFLIVDQIVGLLVAFFHCWAIFLILHYGKNGK